MGDQVDGVGREKGGVQVYVSPIALRNFVPTLHFGHMIFLCFISDIIAQPVFPLEILSWIECPQDG